MALNAGLASGQETAVKSTADGGQDSTDVFLVQHGWHSGVALPSSALLNLGWAQQCGVAHCKYLEFGWGDKRYYTSYDPGRLLAVRAAVFPTASVIHVVCVDRPLRVFFPASDILQFSLDSRGIQGLARYIGSRFQLDAGGRLQDAGKGLYGHSRFYLGTEKFHIFKTCNTWIGRALKAGGVPLGTFGLITAAGLHRRAARYARRVP